MSASVIGIVNQKGGTGKTTTCVNLGIDLAREGKKVMLIDCDPQGSLTISLGYPQPDTLPVTLADLMGKVLSDAPIDPGEGVLHHTEGVDLLPANIALAGMEVLCHHACQGFFRGDVRIHSSIHIRSSSFHLYRRCRSQFFHAFAGFLRSFFQESA